MARNVHVLLRSDGFCLGERRKTAMKDRETLLLVIIWISCLVAHKDFLFVYMMLC